MKKKNKDLEKDQELEAGEEEVEEEEGEDVEEGAGEAKEVAQMVSKKIDEIVKLEIGKLNKQSLVIHRDQPSLEKSVMEQDIFYRRIKPFVKLSGKMEKFITDFKFFAKNGINPNIINKVLTEGNDDEGGFTVPEEFSNEVIRFASEASIVRPRARVWNMTRDIFNVPKLDQNFTSDGDDFAGISFTYDAESGSPTASQPRFGRVTLRAYKFRGYTTATDELLEDSAVNLANYLVSLFGEALAWLEDKQFLQGTGVGRPLGVINAADVTVVTRAASSTVGYADIIGMRTALRPAFRPNAVWIMSRNVEDKILNINATTTEGVKLLGNLKDGVPTTLLGMPFIVTDKLPTTVGTKGDIILGDFSKYFIGDRGTMKVTSSIHDRFQQDETAFKFVMRHDGQPAIPEAFVVLNQAT